MKRALQKIVVFLLIVVLTLIAGCSARSTPAINYSDIPSTTDSYDYDITDLDSLAAHDHIVLTVEDNLQEMLSDDYYIDYVDSIYLSKEYVDELTYNSLSNTYFGYDYDSIAESMSGINWTFTVNDSGQTIVTEVQASSSALLELVKKVAVGTGVIVVCAVVSSISGGVGAAPVACFFAGAAKTAFVSAVSSAAIGGAIGGVIEGVQTHSWDGVLNGALAGAADGFMWGAISGALVGGFSSSYCFTSDTPIKTSTGYKQIQNIRVGDFVYSYNELLNKYSYQPVTAVHQSKTETLIKLQIAGNEIFTTATHPFYTNYGWIEANELTRDYLVLADEGYVQISSIEFLTCNKEIATWNLSVENSHTYTVSTDDIVVHNQCGDSQKLRNNLIKNGESPPKYKNAAHHIVPSSDGRYISAVEARAKYLSLVDDINDYRNGVFLPVSKSVNIATHHSNLHTSKYYTKVYELIRPAKTEEELFAILQYIKKQLLAGTFI